VKVVFGVGLVDRLSQLSVDLRKPSSTPSQQYSTANASPRWANTISCGGGVELPPLLVVVVVIA